MAAAVDFICKLNCKRGLAEVQSVTNMPLPPAGIFDPPFAINVNLTQVPIGTKVSIWCIQPVRSAVLGAMFMLCATSV